MKNYKSKFMKYLKKCKNIQQGGGMCVICGERNANIIAMPCRHLILCKFCTSQHLAQKCPLCNENAIFFAISEDKSMEYIDEDIIKQQTDLKMEFAMPEAAVAEPMNNRQQIPFNKTIDFIIYHLIISYHSEMLEDEQNIEKNADILSRSFMQKHPNIFSKINDNYLFKDYLGFILNKEINNKKIIDKYNKVSDNEKIKLREHMKEQNDDIYNPLFASQIQKWNEILASVIENTTSGLTELKQQFIKDNEIKRDIIYSFITTIQDLFINLPRRMSHLRRGITAIYPQIESSSIADNNLDQVIQDLKDDIDALTALITMVHQNIPRQNLILLFNNLKRHMIDNIPEINNFIGHINVDLNTTTDGEIAGHIHNFLSMIQSTYP
jgi:hypothetical protein